MSSATRIEFDYNRAIAQAQKLDDIAQKLYNLAQNDFVNSMDVLMRGWEGEASNMYIDKGNILCDKIRKTSKDLNNTANSIRKIAKKIYDSEMLALEIAKQRNY